MDGNTDSQLRKYVLRYQSELKPNSGNGIIKSAKDIICTRNVAKKTEKIYNKSTDGINAIINYKSADGNIEKNLINESDKTWKKLLGSEQNAIIEYTDVNYGITNRYLRNALLPDDNIEWDQTKQRVAELDRVLERNTLGDNLFLYRGVDFEEFNAWKNSDVINTYKSTSIDKSITDTFDSVYKIKIKASSNTKGFYIGRYGEHPNEKEFLLHRGQKYKILDIQDTTIEVEFYE